jgi:hypothetical protein
MSLAVFRQIATGSPTGTDFEATFRHNAPYSPSGTNWANTFRQTTAPAAAQPNLSGGTKPTNQPYTLELSPFSNPPRVTPVTPKPTLTQLADTFEAPNAIGTPSAASDTSLTTSLAPHPLATQYGFMSDGGEDDEEE